MTIHDLRCNIVNPFEIEDGKLRNLFSFFLHSAPTIQSTSTTNIAHDRLSINWKTYIEDEWNPNPYEFIPSLSNPEFPTDPKILNDYGLADTSKVSRKHSAFICMKHNDEEDYACLLRHIRNAIAHKHVYFNNAGNRKYIYMEDYNKKNKTVIILINQTKLDALIKTITK